MIADGVLGVILLCMMLVWFALLIYAARRDVKTSRIKYENAQKTRRILIELANRLDSRRPRAHESDGGRGDGGRRRCVMSALYDGWDLSSLLACLKERTDGVVALCRVVLDYEDAGEDARELAEEVLRELDGGDAS